MKLAALVATAFLVASPRGAELHVPPTDSGPPFTPAVPGFPDAAACVAHLAWTVRLSGPPADDAAAGPYVIALGDVRAHRVKARDWGHEIEEFRCLGAKLETRSWTHSLNDVKPITVEDIGRMSFPE